MKTAKFLLLSVLVTVFFFSCSFKSTNLKPQDLNYVNFILDKANINTPRTLKGIGNARIVNKGSRNSIRIAFALKKPCKLRIVALAGGHPIETIATNCYNIYMISHSNKHGFYKKRLTGYTLESLINIPVTTEDIILLLSGGFPVKDYDYMELNRNINGTSVISLKKRWSGLQEKIYTKNGIVEKVSIYDSGKLKYSVNMKYKKFNKYLLPYNFKFEKDLRNYFSLSVQRLWPDQPVKTSTFVLTPKD